MTYYARNLPHWQPPGSSIFITWRLHGSLPARFKISKSLGSTGKQFVAYDRALDTATAGPLWLKEPRIADCVVTAIRKCEARKLFRLNAYVLMTNHVHILIEPISSLAQITKILKGRSAHDANQILGRSSARFWQTESFDHWIRTPAEWQRIRKYIEQNPVKAGLVQSAADWPWSSASHPIK